MTTFRRVLGTASLLMLLLSIAAPPAQRAAARYDDAPVDLAAMALTPGDLEAAGLDGHGSGIGLLLTVDQMAAAAPRADRDDLRDVLEDIGLIASYIVPISRPVDEGTRGSNTTVYAASYLAIFADEEGAAEYFSITAPEPDDELDEDTGTIGDESVVSREAGDEKQFLPELTADFGTNDPAVLVNLTLRVGRVVAGVDVIDVVRPGEDEEAADADVMAALGEGYVDRIDAGLDGDAPDLGARVVRLQHPDAGNPAIETDSDRYIVRDGDWIRRFSDDEDTIDRQNAIVSGAGILDTYLVDHDVRQKRASIEYDPDIEAQVSRFADADAADDWLEEGEEWFAEVAGVTEIDPVAGADEFGDASITLEYEGLPADVPFFGYVVIVRVGDAVAYVQASSPDGISLGTVEELSAAQVACLEETGGCPEPMTAPEELLET